MRRKELVAVIIVAALCLIGAGGYALHQHMQETQWQERLDQAQANIKQARIDEPVRVTWDPDSAAGFDGTLEVTVHGGAIYNGPQAAAAAEGLDYRDFWQSQEEFERDQESDNPRAVVLYHVTINNIDATPREGASHSGKPLFFMDGLAGMRPDNGILYISDSESDPDRGYFSLAPGEQKTYALAYGVSKQSADDAAFTVSGGSQANGPYVYRVDLPVEDKRETSS